MRTIQLLEGDDIIQKTDWCRPLSLVFTGQSDYLETNNTYGGSPMNRCGWIPAYVICPYYVGKTVDEKNKIVSTSNRPMTEVTLYEFVRGDLPDAHIEKLTDEENIDYTELGE